MLHSLILSTYITLYKYNKKKTYLNSQHNPRPCRYQEGCMYILGRQQLTVVSQKWGMYVYSWFLFLYLQIDGHVDRLSLSLSPKSEKQIITDRQFLKSMLCIKLLYLSFERILNIIPATMRVLPSRKSAERVDYVLPDCREFPLTVICL